MPELVKPRGAGRMSEQVVIDVPVNNWQPVEVGTIRLGPGRWEITSTAGNGRDDCVLIFARKLEEPRG